MSQKSRLYHLGDLPGGVQGSRAFDISSDGSVVVGNSASEYSSEAFRWDADTGIMQGLGVLKADHTNSSASGVSGDGSIVVGGSNEEAFIWTQESGEMKSLIDVLRNTYKLTPELIGWELNIAFAISTDGNTIVGRGTNPNGQTEAWRAHIGPEIKPPGPECLAIHCPRTNKRSTRSEDHEMRHDANHAEFQVMPSKSLGLPFKPAK